MRRNWRSWIWQLGIVSSLATIGAIALNNNRVSAQVVPDRTLGRESSVVNRIDRLRDRIDGGATRGENLFHSFQEFNVGEGRGVYFANPEGITNILSRVTGGNPSHILGRLGVLGGANLFLLNPNGILFGANSSLDISGSFVATTADGIQLGENGFFSATEPEKSRLLSVSPGVAFFEQAANTPGVIVNRGNLAVGKDLTFSAGNLDLQGQLVAGRNLTLQALDKLQIRDSKLNPFVAAAKGDLLVLGNQKVDIFALNHPASGLFAGRDLVLRSANTVGGDAHFWSGGNFRIEKMDGNLGDLSSPRDPVIRANGDVFLNSYEGASLHILAGGLVYIPGTIAITGTEDTANSLSEVVTLSNGTTIAIDGSTAPTLDIRAGTKAVGNPFIDTGTPTSADIVIGNIFVNPVGGRGGTVLLTNQYQPNTALTTLGGIIVGSINTGDLFGGGNVALDSRGGIALNGNVNASAFPVRNSLFGNGGNVSLLAEDNIITSSGIFAQGLLGGNITFTSAGNVSLTNGNDLVSVSNSRITSNIGSPEGFESIGNVGTIAIEADSVLFSDGSQLQAGFFSGGRGNGGLISIKAANLVSLDNTGFFADAESGAVGNSSDIEISGRNVSLANGSLLKASNAGQGNGGNIAITASENVSLTNGTQVNVVAGGGGNIAIDAKNVEILEGSSLLAGIGEGLGNPNAQAGDIEINARENVKIEGNPTFVSGIENAVNRQGKGNAGNIVINTNSLEGIGSFLINSSVYGEGNAGSISITAKDNIFLTGVFVDEIRNGQIFKIPDGKIFSSVQETGIGNGANIFIQAPSLSFSTTTILR